VLGSVKVSFTFSIQIFSIQISVLLVPAAVADQSSPLGRYMFVCGLVMPWERIMTVVRLVMATLDIYVTLDT
jgi:hypothetical protein